MKKRVTISLFAIVLSMVLAACGSSSKEYASDSAAAEAPMEMMEEAAVEEMADAYYGEEYAESEAAGGMENGGQAPEVDESAVSDRKLIKTVDLSVETKNYDGLMVSLETQIEELGGYIEALESYNGGYYEDYRNRTSNITARIPADKLEGFIDQVSEVANIVSRSESVEDVTLRYVDLDSHARMLEEEQNRLLDFLKEAQTIEEIIVIESRLSEVKYQLESMRSQLRTYDNKVNYSTVHIYIDEVRELTPVVQLTAGERIAEGFTSNVVEIMDSITEFCIDFVINIPYIVFWAVIMAVLVFVGLKVVKLVDKKTEENRKKYERNEKGGVRFYNRPAERRQIHTDEQNNRTEDSDHIE